MLRSLIVALLIILSLSKPGPAKKSAVLNVIDVDLAENSLLPIVLKNLDPTKAIMVVVEQSPSLVFSPFEIKAKA